MKALIDRVDLPGKAFLELGEAGEAILHGSRHNERLVARDKHADPHGCVEKLVEKLERQLEKGKERRKSHRGPSFAGDGKRTGKSAAGAPHEVTTDDVKDVSLAPRLAEEAGKLRAAYAGERPREIGELLELLERGRPDEIRRNLGGVYQRLAAQGKIPEPVLETFRELQKLTREATPARPA